MLEHPDFHSILPELLRWWPVVAWLGRLRRKSDVPQSPADKGVALTVPHDFRGEVSLSVRSGHGLDQSPKLGRKRRRRRRRARR